MDKKTAEYMEKRVLQFRKLDERKTYLEAKSEQDVKIDISWGSGYVKLNDEQRKLVKEFIIDIFKEEIAAIEKQMEEI